MYAQVTAGAIIGPEWVILVDTLAVPDETLEMRAFIEENLGVPVRYIVNTIYHADHTFGNYFFPGVTIFSHDLCRKMILEKNEDSLITQKSRPRNSGVSNGSSRRMSPCQKGRSPCGLGNAM